VFLVRYVTWTLYLLFMVIISFFNHEISGKIREEIGR